MANRRTVLIFVLLVVSGSLAAVFFARSMPAHSDRLISRIAISNNRTWLAVGTPGGRIFLWGRDRSRSPRQVNDQHGSLNDLDFSPDGHWLAVASRHLTLYPVDPKLTRVTVRDDDRNYGSVRFSPDGGNLLTIAGNGATELIDLPSRSSVFYSCCSTIYGDVAFAPNQSIYIAGHWPSIWDLPGAQLLARLTRYREEQSFGPIAFDRVNNLALMGSQDGRVYAWDLATHQLRGSSPAHSGYVQTIAVLGESGWVAFATLGKPVQLWNVVTGAVRALPDAIASSNILYDPQLGGIVLGTADGAVVQWLFDGRPGPRVNVIP